VTDQEKQFFAELQEFEAVVAELKRLRDALLAHAVLNREEVSERLDAYELALRSATPEQLTEADLAWLKAMKISL